MPLTNQARTLLCLLATACTPMRSQPNSTSSNPNGPQIHGEIQTSASGRGGMAAASPSSTNSKTPSDSTPSSGATASAQSTATSQGSPASAAPIPESKARDLT